MSRPLRDESGIGALLSVLAIFLVIVMGIFFVLIVPLYFIFVGLGIFIDFTE